MTAPEGNSSFCFPRISVICYIAGNFEAENSLNLAVTGVVRQHSWVTVHSYLLMSHNVARSEILSGNSFIVRCHVTSK